MGIENLIKSGMFQSLLKVALRNIRREKFFSLLNILGLSVGMCCVIFVMLYVVDEVSYDQFHTQASRIYRINQTFIWGEDDNLFGSTGPAVAEAVQVEIPEFEKVTRVHTPGAMKVSYEDRKPYSQFYEDGVLAVDDNFLEVFTFPMLSGDPTSALKEPYSILLTEESKEKYFGEANAIGEILWVGEFEDRKAYKVTGLLKDVPTNSHIDFDLLISMNSIPKVKDNGWSWIWTTFVTFGLLNDETVAKNLDERLLEVPRKHAGVSLKRLQNVTFEEWESEGKEWKLYAQPLLDIHLFSQNVYSRLNEVGDIRQVVMFGVIGFLILMMCIVNFVNLTTARSFSRAKEVGIRKVVGSPKHFLIFQFLIESVVLSGISMLIGLLLVELFLPFFNTLSGKSLVFSPVASPWLMVSLLIAPAVIGIVAGLYPAFFLTSFMPIKALKNKMGSSSGNTNVRNALVVFQFAVSIILISATIIIFNQLQYQKNVDLGFNRDNKLIVQNVDLLRSSTESFVASVENMNEVDHLSVSGSTPPYFFNSDNFNIKGATHGDFPLRYVVADEGFLSVYGIEVLAGRDFRKDTKEANRALVNEALIKQLGIVDYNEIVGKKLTYYENEIEVIGLFRDFNTDYTNKVRPLAVLGEGTEVFTFPGRHLSISMKEQLSLEETQQFVQRLEQSWKSFNESSEFQYAFLDQAYEAQFRPTLYFGQLISAFSILTLIIASLGLIGLMTFSIEKRGKEIGVRKVLGASISQIFALLSRQYALLLLIAFVIAVPVTWYFMEGWLQGFEQRKGISVFDFALGGILMLIIALMVTSLQMVKASMANPVEALKDE